MCRDQAGPRFLQEPRMAQSLCSTPLTLYTGVGADIQRVKKQNSESSERWWKERVELLCLLFFFFSAIGLLVH